MATTRQIVNTDKAPQPIGPYAQAIKAGNLLFLSGQIAINPKSGEVVKSSFADQCRTVLENLKAVLTAGGSSIEQVVKTTIFLTDMNKFTEFNAIYGEYFGTAKPARATVEVRRLPKDVEVEIEAIALCN
jgi:2-iminobutanoate/2-iminopropanoate deaminase